MTDGGSVQVSGRRPQTRAECHDGLRPCPFGGDGVLHAIMTRDARKAARERLNDTIWMCIVVALVVAAAAVKVLWF